MPNTRIRNTAYVAEDGWISMQMMLSGFWESTSFMHLEYVARKFPGAIFVDVG